jgi:hypothetical protein
MGQSRSERAKEFNKQLYVAASFFKMTSFSDGTAAKDGTVLNPRPLEWEVNRTARREHGLRPFPHPAADQQCVPAKEPWEKSGKIARGEAVTRINAENDAKCGLSKSTDSPGPKSGPSNGK